MSVKAYVGRPGNGKTYEVVSVVILGALSTGRRVLTNIAGINYEAICDHLTSKGTPLESIGRIKQVPHEAVLERDFWLSEKVNKESAYNVDAETIQPGDLLVIDEVWRFWNGFDTRDCEGKRRPATVMEFFRMHRHFVHPESGVACDVVLISQDVLDINRAVRAVIEETYRMLKHTAVGSTKWYRVDVFSGGNSRYGLLRQFQRQYDPEFFDLYQSHSGKKSADLEAQEVNVDKRGNVLFTPMLKYGVPISLVVMAFGAYHLYGFFTKPPVPKSSVPVVSQDSSSKPPGPSPVSPVVPARPPALPLSESWRVVGWVKSSIPAVGSDQPQTLVILKDGNGARRYISPPGFKRIGEQIEILMPDGEFATFWTGSHALSKTLKEPL